MASKYEISTVFKMIDNWSGPLKNIAGSSSGFAKQFSADMRKTEMQIQAAGRAMKRMAGVAVAAGAAVAGKAVVDGVKTYIEFEDAITKAGTKFKDLDVTSESFNDTLEQLQSAAREVGAATKFSAVDSANALDKMAMAGITSEDAMKMLMGTTNLAAAAGTDLTTAVDIATDALGIYGKDLASKGFAGVDAQLDKISDVMAKAGILANTDLQGLFEAMTYAGPSFVTAGQSIETFSAAMGTLASAGIKGSSAGTALNAIFTQLGKADKRAKLEGLGVSVQDAQGNFRNLIDIVADLEKSLEGMGNVEKKSLLNSIFDVRGEKAITALMTAGSDAIRNFENELINSQGTAANVTNVQMQSFQGMIEQLKAAYQDKQLSLAKAFEVGGAKEALAGLIAYVQNFDITPFANLLTNIMQALPGIIEGLGNVFQFLWNMKDVIGALVIAWGAYKVALIGALVVKKVIGFVTAIQAVMAATEGMTAAQAALNVVMNANPIGLIVTAVAALGLGVYELIKHWDSVSAAMARAWDWIKNIASIIWDNLIGALEVAVGWLTDVAWAGFINVLSSIGNWFASISSTIWDNLIGAIEVVVGWLTDVAWTGFINVLSSIGNWFASISSTIWNNLIGAIEVVVGWLTDVAWAGFINVLSSIGNWFASISSLIWDNLIGAIEVAVGWLTDVAWAGFINVLSSIGNWFAFISSTIWDNLIGALDLVKNFIIEFQPLLTMLLGPLGMVVNMIVEIVKNFNNIKEGFTNGGFIAGIKAIGGTILSSILAPIQKVLEVMTKIPFIGDKVQGGLDMITGMRQVSREPVSITQGGLDMITGMRQNALNSKPLTVPVTQGERTAYTMNETVTEDHVKIDVALEKGLNGTVSGSAPKTSLNLINSGSW